MKNLFHGTGVALITPFKSDLTIDFEAYQRIIEYVISENIDFLVPLGSTGESATLNEEEARQCLDFVIHVNNGRKPILAGNFGGNNTLELVKKIQEYNFAGIDGILSSSPAYVKPNQEGIFSHYMAIAEVSPVPIIIYNVPGRTKSNIEWSTTIRLANASDKFVGIKEASGDLIQATRIIKNKPEGFIVTSGDDEVAMPMIAAGGDGVISVIANACPGYFTKMSKYCINGDLEKARDCNFKTYDLHKWLYIEGNPVGIKSAMEVLGFCENHVRLPLHTMSKDNYESLKKCVLEIKKIADA
ncbi:MAG: 4-hydroxy-tetrahydrodipicolinate synthase [Saprospiraceae bacterium]|nr:4-hydroxy-tetrahydrodipicolinate synthase [Bacteroidia bacterium]NNL90779.1 4-hydroxy-tetrahydrodipicolinate synthase [Saprospiraceae bacterium]